jgi:hypothetical protein
VFQKAPAPLGARHPRGSGDESASRADSMEKFFSSNPGFRSRIAHYIDELLEIARARSACA